MERGMRQSRIGLVLIIVGSVFLLTAGAAFAAGSSGAALVQEGALPPRSSESAGLATTGAITGTVPITGGQIVAGCISTFFNVEITQVMDLRSEGYGFGELAIAYALSEESGEDVDYILALKESGMGWGEIAMVLGLHPSNRDRNLGRIISGRAGISGTIPVGAQRLAERLGVDAEEVTDLLDEGASYGTVIVAYKLAEQYGVSPGEMVARRLAGDSWGQIKRQLSSSAGAAQQPGSSDGNDSPQPGGPPDHAKRPDHAGPKEGRGKGPK